MVLFFDGDEAGRKAVEKVGERLKEILPKAVISKVETPEAEDINSLAQGHEPEVFSHLLKNRKPVFLSTESKNEKVEELPKAAHEAKKSPFDTTNQNHLVFTSETAIYHVKGGVPLQLDSLKVSLHIGRKTGASIEQSPICSRASKYRNWQGRREIF